MSNVFCKNRNNGKCNNIWNNRKNGRIHGVWIGRKKDSIALGNITGAMVFQSCFPVVFGMLFTSWNLTGITLVSAVLAITSAAFHLVWIKLRGNVNTFALLFSGLLYAALMIYIFR